MIVSITFKDPDGVGDCIEEAVRRSVPTGLSEEEADAALEIRRDSVKKKLAKWIEYGEYIAIDFDLDAGTATVKPRK